MKILFLTQILPFPPDAGPRVKTWHVLRYLAEKGHQVFLATFLRPDEAVFLPHVEAVCEKVYPVRLQRSRLRDGLYFLRSLFSERPFLIERDDVPEMREVVHQVLVREGIDVIHADQIGMAQYALLSDSYRDTRPATLFDSHNAVWMVIERMAENIPRLIRAPMRMEARKMKRYETGLLSSFDRIMTVTDKDKSAYLAALRQTPGSEDGSANANISSIPIAVDTAALPVKEWQPDSQNILTLGTLHYPPNADGIRWFLQQVYPSIRKVCPESTLTIVGKNPPPDFRAFAAGRNDVDVTGYVPVLDPYVDAAALMVVPVRAGGGMRVRILEAFARGIPVVTTTIGMEGIRAVPGEHVLVADGPQEFAEQVLRLLQDPALGLKLAKNGRRLAEETYDWQVVLRALDAVYQRLVP